MKMLTTMIAFGGLAAATAASAAPPSFGTLTFDTRLGTATSTQAIPVFLTFTLDPASVPLTTGPDAQITSGLTDQNITDAGFDPTVFTDRLVNEAAECSGTFFNGCGSSTSAYNFNFNFDAPAFVTPTNFDLEPGQSYSFLFGTFTPNGTGAAPGVYQFFNANIHFQLTNADHSQNAEITVANTCTGQDPTCAFTRTVTAAPGAVPEPAAWALMIGGFGLVGTALRRRTVVAA